VADRGPVRCVAPSFVPTAVYVARVGSIFFLNCAMVSLMRVTIRARRQRPAHRIVVVAMPDAVAQFESFEEVAPHLFVGKGQASRWSPAWISRRARERRIQSHLTRQNVEKLVLSRVNMRRRLGAAFHPGNAEVKRSIIIFRPGHLAIHDAFVKPGVHSARD
jgi:hypothetical protein